jgi:hypothetical protein
VTSTGIRSGPVGVQVFHDFRVVVNQHRPLGAQREVPEPAEHFFDDVVDGGVPEGDEQAGTVDAAVFEFFGHPGQGILDDSEFQDLFRLTVVDQQAFAGTDPVQVADVRVGFADREKPDKALAGR